MATICRLHFLKGDPASTCIAMFGLICVPVVSEMIFTRFKKKENKISQLTKYKLKIKEKNAGHYMIATARMLNLVIIDIWSTVDVCFSYMNLIQILVI